MKAASSVAFAILKNFLFDKLKAAHKEKKLITHVLDIDNRLP